MHRRLVAAALRGPLHRNQTLRPSCTSVWRLAFRLRQPLGCFSESVVDCSILRYAVRRHPHDVALTGQVTLGMVCIGATKPLRGCLIFISQILGALAAAAIVSGLFPGPLNVSTTLGGGASIVQGLFIEMFLTTQLVLTIFMLAAEKHKATFIAPVGIGLSLFIAELTGSLQCLYFAEQD